MIVRFNSRGKGTADSAINYLLGADRNRQGASMLRGNIEQTREIINSLNFARNYTSGCLSFAERDIPEDQKNELMNSFEQIIFAGLEHDQYEVSWIQHTDKNRLELNFLIANVDLNSGKRFQPYFDKADKTRINAWQNLCNDTYLFHDPNDPKNAAALTHSRDLPKKKQQAIEKITNSLLSMIDKNKIKNRADIINILEKSGYEITRQTKSSISIKNPRAKNSYRLSGAIYKQDFSTSAEAKQMLQQKIKGYEAERPARISQNQKTLLDAQDIKVAYNQKRYKKAETKVKKAYQAESVLETQKDLAKQKTENQTQEILKNDRDRATLTTRIRSVTAKLRTAVLRVSNSIRRFSFANRQRESEQFNRNRTNTTSINNRKNDKRTKDISM